VSPSPIPSRLASQHGNSQIMAGNWLKGWELHSLNFTHLHRFPAQTSLPGNLLPPHLLFLWS
jgi:hypothetical protein